MVGKSTAACMLASRLQYECVSTDDIGAAITAVTNTSTHPAFHYMGTQDYRDYYANTMPEKLIEDIEKQHAALWPALRTLFQNHVSWGRPIIIEGWALRPNYVSELSGDISGVFLMADVALIEKRICSCDFSAGASDPKGTIDHYLKRSIIYNTELQNQVSQLGLPEVHVSEDMEPFEIVEACIHKLEKEGNNNRIHQTPTSVAVDA